MSEKQDAGPGLWEQLGELEHDEEVKPYKWSTSSVEENSSPSRENEAHTPIAQPQRSTASVASSAVGMALNCAKQAYSVTPLASDGKVNTDTGYQTLIQNDAQDSGKIDFPNDLEDDDETTGMLGGGSKGGLAADVWNTFGGNLDEFYRHAYEFYYEKGAATFICSKISNLLTLFFTVAVTGFVFVWVDWDTLKKTCENKNTCNSQSYIRKDPLGEFHTLWSWIIITFFAFYTLYCTWNLYLFLFHDIWRIRRMSKFFREHLKISSNELQVMSWDNVVGRMQELHRSGSRVEVHEDPPTALDIAMRIMREENVFVALVNQGLFDFEVGIGICCCKVASLPVYLGKSLEMSLTKVVIGDVFDTRFRVRQGWRDGSASGWLRRKIRLFALLNILVMPFLVLFLVCYFVLNVAHEFHQKSAKSALHTSRWTPLAKWHFREYNELPHVFEKRMANSIPHGMSYLKQFHNPWVVVLARCVSFIAGGIVGVILIALNIGNEGVLTIEVLPSLTILQLLTISGVILGSARSVIPSVASKEHETQKDPNDVLKDMAKHTHYMPLTWRDRGHTKQVYDNVCSMFKNPIKLFLEDLLSALLTPYILWTMIAPQSDRIISTVNGLIESHGRLGDICGPATFQRRGYYSKSETFRSAPTVVSLEEGKAGNSDDLGSSMSTSSWAAVPTNEALEELATSWNDPGEKLKLSYQNFRLEHAN